MKEQTNMTRKNMERWEWIWKYTPVSIRAAARGINDKLQQEYRESKKKKKENAKRKWNKEKKEEHGNKRRRVEEGGNDRKKNVNWERD